MVINNGMLTLYEIQLRHAFYYQQVLQRVAESYLESGAAAKHALEKLELEWANIEAGHRWASEKSTGETALHCVRRTQPPLLQFENGPLLLKN